MPPRKRFTQTHLFTLIGSAAAALALGIYGFVGQWLHHSNAAAPDVSDEEDNFKTGHATSSPTTDLFISCGGFIEEFEMDDDAA